MRETKIHTNTQLQTYIQTKTDIGRSKHSPKHTGKQIERDENPYKHTDLEIQTERYRHWYKQIPVQTHIHRERETSKQKVSFTCTWVPSANLQSIFFKYFHSSKVYLGSLSVVHHAN